MNKYAFLLYERSVLNCCPLSVYLSTYKWSWWSSRTLLFTPSRRDDSLVNQTELLLFSIHCLRIPPYHLHHSHSMKPWVYAERDIIGNTGGQLVCLGQLCNLLLASGLHRLCAKCTISSRQQDGAAPAQKHALKIRRHQHPAGSFRHRRGVSVLRLGSARPQERTKNCFPSFSNGNKGAPTLCKSLCCRPVGVRQRSIFCGEDLPVSSVYWAVWPVRWNSALHPMLALSCWVSPFHCVTRLQVTS